MYHSLVGRGKSSYDPAALRDVKLSVSDVALKAVAGLPQVRRARRFLLFMGLCQGRESPCALVPLSSSVCLLLSVARDPVCPAACRRPPPPPPGGERVLLERGRAVLSGGREQRGHDVAVSD